MVQLAHWRVQKDSPELPGSPCLPQTKPNLRLRGAYLVIDLLKAIAFFLGFWPLQWLFFLDVRFLTADLAANLGLFLKYLQFP
jgi:hypothetical protein